MKERAFTHVVLTREVRDFDNKIVCSSELKIESPCPILEKTAHLPQEEVFDFCIDNYPGWVPMAYTYKEKT